MPKRSCPFNSDLNTNPVKRQIIDENGSISTISKMKIIYDRTMRMLFEGANTAQVVHPTSNCHHELMDQGESRYHQTFLDSRLRLQSKSSAVGQLGLLSDNFHGDTSLPCSFCDKRLPNGQGKECSRCKETFCHLCSSERFNNFSDQFVCLGCG